MAAGHYAFIIIIIHLILQFFIFKDFIYLFVERGEEMEEEGEASMCGCLLSAPYWGHGLQPRQVPCLGIEPATRWSIGRHSTR